MYTHLENTRKYFLLCMNYIRYIHFDTLFQEIIHIFFSKPQVIIFIWFNLEKCALFMPYPFSVLVISEAKETDQFLCPLKCCIATETFQTLNISLIPFSLPSVWPGLFPNNTAFPMDKVALVQEFSVRVSKIHIMMSYFFDSASKYWMTVCRFQNAL